MYSVKCLVSNSKYKLFLFLILVVLRPEKNYIIEKVIQLYYKTNQKNNLNIINTLRW